MPLFTLRQFPKDDPRAIFTLPGKDEPTQPPSEQKLSLEYKPLKRDGAHRNALRAIDMPLSTSPRERAYLEDRAPAKHYIKTSDGQQILTEERSPSTKQKKEEKRRSLNMPSLSTSPRSPRSPKTPVIVSNHSPRLLPLGTEKPARIPTPEVTQFVLPEPPPLPRVPTPIPFVVRAPTGEEGKKLHRKLQRHARHQNSTQARAARYVDEYESDESYSTDSYTESEEDDRSSHGSVRPTFKEHKPRKSGKKHRSSAPPSVPEAPPIVVNPRKERSGKHSPRVGYEHESFDGEDDLSEDIEAQVRRSRSHREAGGEREGEGSSRRRRRRYHHRRYHHSTREDREDEERRDRERLAPVERPSERGHRRSRSDTGAVSSGRHHEREARPEGRRERSWTTTKEYRSTSTGGQSDGKREPSGLLESPQDVRRRELVAEREIFGEDGTRVKKYHYR